MDKKNVCWFVVLDADVAGFILEENFLCFVGLWFW